MLQRIIIAIFLFAGALLPLHAQNNVTKNEIRDKAIDVIQKDYERYASLNGDDAQYNFLRLFVNSEAPVYNDLLGLSSAKSLSASEYSRLLGNPGIKSRRVTIKNIQIDREPWMEGGEWKIMISFNKDIAYYNECGVYFSNKEFYHSDYYLKVIMVYDNLDGKCRIERIDGSIDSSRQLPPDFFVFKETDKRDRQLFYAGQPLVFNSDHQAIISGELNRTAFSHVNKRLKFQPSIDGCNIVTMLYPTKEFPDNGMRLRLTYGLGLGDGLSLSGDSMMNNPKTSSSGFGIDFGYRLLETSSFSLFGYAGLGMTMTKIDLGYTHSGDYIYTADASADIDEETYERHYVGLNTVQSIKTTDLSIPLYLDGELKLSDAFALYADLGLRFNLNISSKFDLQSLTADEVYGVYPQYDNLVLGSEWGFNGFRKQGTIEIRAEGEDLACLSGVTIDLLGGLGARFSIPQTPLSIEIGASYLMGLNNMMSADDKGTELSNVKNSPLVYYVASEDKEHVRSLTDALESVKRSSLLLKFGIIYKF